MKKLLLLGDGSFALEVADVVADVEGYQVTGFSANQNREGLAQKLDGKPVLWVDELAALAGSHLSLGAIGSTRRQAFTRQVESMGFRFATVVHPSSRVSKRATLASGTLVSPGCLVSSFADIGRHVLINRAVSVGHHTTIGDHCTISPGVTIGGHCHLGAQVFVGLGASVRNGICIGEGSVVGVGAAVVKDVPPRCQVVGVPARVVKTEIDPL